MATTGAITFTTTPTESSDFYGVTAWSNPGNATVNNSTFATCALAASDDSKDLRFRLSDIGLPNGRTISAFTVTAYAKTNSITGNAFVNYLIVNLTTTGYGTAPFYNLTTVDTLTAASAGGSATATWALTGAQLTTSWWNSDGMLCVAATSNTSAKTISIDYVTIDVTYSDALNANNLTVNNTFLMTGHGS